MTSAQERGRWLQRAAVEHAPTLVDRIAPCERLHVHGAVFFAAPSSL